MPRRGRRVFDASAMGSSHGRYADEDAYRASALMSTGTTGMRPQPDVDIKGDGRGWAWKRGNPNATKSQFTFMAGGLNEGYGGGGVASPAATTGADAGRSRRRAGPYENGERLETSPSRKRPAWLATPNARAPNGSPTTFRNAPTAPGL